MGLKMLKLRSELKQAQAKLDELRKKQTEYKTRTDELEKSLAEAVTDEEVELVERSIAELEEEIGETDIDADIAEAEKEVERVGSEIADLEKRAKAVHKPAERKENFEMNKTVKGFWSNVSAEVRSAVLADDTVKDFLVRMKAMKGQQRAVTGSDLLIPDVMLSLLRDNLHRYSKLVSVVNLKPVKGKARQTVAGTVPEGVWTEAIGVLNELTFSFSQVEVDGYKVGGFIPVHNSVLEDSDINLSGEIMDMLSQAVGIAVDKAILYGTGTKMPLGIMTRLAQTTKPSTWSDSAPAWVNFSVTNLLKIDSSLSDVKFFAALIKALGTAKANYSDGELFWAMSSSTKTTILSKAIAFNSAGAVVAGVNDIMPVIGGKIITLDFIPDGDIIGGYGSLYLLAERGGTSIGVSEHAKFVEDMTVFKVTARYDGMPVLGEGFIAVNINNTAPVTSATFKADSANTPPAEDTVEDNG